MRNKKRGTQIIFIFAIFTLIISGCTQSLSNAPVATPTSLPDDLFVSPLPSAENPMAMIEEFALQTAAAQTSVAGGTPGTPQAITTVGTLITAQAGDIATATPNLGTPSTPTNAIATTPAVGVVNTPSGPTTTPVPDGVRPPTYVLQSGEFPYCIARRFNVDPDALISASGIADPDVYYAGLKLTIPQSGAFPGARSLASHPTTYTVTSSSETIYGIACRFGDVDPASIASANNISISAQLTAGQALKIP